MNETATTNGKALTKKKAQEVPALMHQFDLEKRAGEGQEGATQDDYAMPFLSLLQSNSPQASKADPRYIENATEGMFMNTMTKDLYDGESGVIVIPCAYRRAFIEWKLRENGGGFIREHSPASVTQNDGRNFHIKDIGSTIRDDKNRDIIEANGNELKDTRYWYVLVLRDDGNAEPAVIGMTRTQIKPSRTWFTMQARNEWPDEKERAEAPPSYVWQYVLGVTAQVKDEFSFWNFTIERGDPVTNQKIMGQAIAFHDAVKAGQIREATDSLSETEGGEEPVESNNY